MQNVENKMNCKPLSGAAIEVGIPTIESLRIFNLRYLMERLRVVTAEQREGFLFVVCQCPHGLELLLETSVTGYANLLFQCPHGLELLPGATSSDLEKMSSVSMPSWA